MAVPARRAGGGQSPAHTQPVLAQWRRLFASTTTMAAEPNRRTAAERGCIQQTAACLRRCHRWSELDEVSTELAGRQQDRDRPGSGWRHGMLERQVQASLQLQKGGHATHGAM